MEKQITIKDIYRELKNLEKALQNKGIISQSELSSENEVIWDWPENIHVLADEKLLSEDWLSPEDEEAWKGL
ncbi:hypothetical protein COU60_05630 [Candidatus Pacearchaeota archaeon CG10_big_fil_rev_8_21_14_0_10_34_76]|nr:MAG: hypothetical protein COU60_05630 [Candidatus Pacearchaeota archaeon CG10_big_fil_rev_8_21_14_0_10_34_76]